MFSMPIHFHCSGCGGQHKRPIGAKCQYKDSDVDISGFSNVNKSKVQKRVSFALNVVSSGLEAIEKRIDKTEEHIHGKSTDYSGGFRSGDIYFSSPSRVLTTVTPCMTLSYPAPSFSILFIWGFTSLSTLYRSYHDG